MATAFAALKETLSTVLMLHLHDFTNPFVVDYDVYGTSLVQCSTKVPSHWRSLASRRRQTSQRGHLQARDYQPRQEVRH
jgi:hypothetical protein